MEGEEDTTFTKLFVGNLLRSTNGIGLRDYFQRFGTVAAANVVHDANGKSRCFGFVTFVYREGAAIACQNRFHNIDGRRVNCNLAAFPEEISQESSRNRGPRMHFGGAAPDPSSSPFVGYPLPYINPYGSPNYPMYGPVRMYGVPPVYPYDQTSGSDQLATSNYPMYGVGPMYGAGPMYGVPPVNPYDQPSGSNQPVTSNNPIHDPGSVPPVHTYGQASASNEPVTSNNPMDDPGSVPHDQASGSNESTNDSANSSVEEVTTIRLEVYR